MFSKIAIFRALHLGDMLCIIPTVRAIRAAWPNAEIFLIGLPWQEEFAKRFNPYFDHFIEFPGWPGLPEREPDPEKIIAFLHHIRTFEFDLVLQMQGNGEITNALCMLWGAKQLCGLRKAGEYAPDERMFPVSEDGEHEITRFFKLLKCLNIAPQGVDLEYPLSKEEESRALTLLRSCGLGPKRFVCIHPGARDVRRRWAIDNFAFIANEVSSRGFPILLTGSGDEAALLSGLQQKIDASCVNIVEAYGHVTAAELAGILKHARLLVSNDTGVSHMASALQVPSIIIFSPYSAFERWRPLNATCNVAVPPEAARDPKYVLQKVVEMLMDTKSHLRPVLEG